MGTLQNAKLMPQGRVHKSPGIMETAFEMLQRGM
jgi:hypothetical protein